jgi:hypothetical protein
MNLINLAIILVYMATYIVIVPIVVAIYFYAYQSKALKILLIGLGVVLFFDVLLLFFNAKNTFLYIFSAVDVLIIACMFSVAIVNKRISKIVLITGFLFVPFIGFDAFFYSGITSNGYSNSLEKIFVLVVVIYYLTQLMQNELIDNLNEQPLFWICIGNLAYNIIGLFDVFSKHMLSYSQTLYLQFYMIWSIVAIFMYCCFTYAFWRSKYTPYF